MRDPILSNVDAAVIVNLMSFAGMASASRVKRRVKTTPIASKVRFVGMKHVYKIRAPHANRTMTVPTPVNFA